MTFNVSEQHALLGAGASAMVPTLAGEIGVDNLIVSFADAAFEGDRGSASFVSSIGFGAISLAMLAMAVVGPLSGITGMLAVGIGGGFGALAVQTFLAGDGGGA